MSSKLLIMNSSGDSTWFSLPPITPSDTNNNQYFGTTVSVSDDGNTCIVGASVGKSTNAFRGAAYIFVRNGAVWTQQVKLAASVPASNNYFGASVSISADGNTCVVGAYNDGGSDYIGAAYVFTRSGTTWTQQARITASDAAAGDYFGNSVSISPDGNDCLIGARVKANVGAAYVFTRSGSVWSQQAKLTASDAAAGDNFGAGVDIASGNCVICAPYKNHSGLTAAGAAYVFSRSGTTWTQQARLTSSVPSNNEYLASASMTPAGNIIAIGATRESGYGYGSAFIFEKSGSVWNQTSVLQSGVLDASENSFGASIALSSDGKTCIVGSPYSNNHSTTASGTAYIFNKVGANWIRQPKKTAPTPTADAGFGAAVALSSLGNVCIVGQIGNQAISFAR